MFPQILVGILIIVLVMMVAMTYQVRKLMARDAESEAAEKFSRIQAWLNAGIVVTILAIVATLFYLFRGTPYEAHLSEWLNIVVRVMHITFGIAWIGASFYFVFLENALDRGPGNREELAGHLWAVHGGGFYYLEKYKVAPKTIPRHLHWFKYEAYFTWVSGFALLGIIYYFNGAALLIDRAVMDLSALQAIGISIGSLVGGWILYDLLCKSPLKEKPVALALTIVLLLLGFAWMYSHVFSGRGAFLHFGALLGSLMAANVFFVIIPAQKLMVQAAKKGQAPDPAPGRNALRRSIHNNYFTFPVLFVMVSNHFPGTFGNSQPWLVLAAISLGAAGIKHWLNLREQGRISSWILPASAIVLLATAYGTAPATNSAECREVRFAEVYAIVQQRCQPCHSQHPTDNVYTVAPNGVKYDTPAEILARKDLILQRVVVTKTMPQNNKTNITPEERALIGCWIQQGARTE